MNLLNLENDSDIEEYYDTLTNNKFMPLITLPTRITKSSKTLIDNIFYNEFSNQIFSGNLTIGISDHMPQFAIIPRNELIDQNIKSQTKIIRTLVKKVLVTLYNSAEWIE